MCLIKIKFCRAKMNSSYQQPTKLQPKNSYNAISPRTLSGGMHQEITSLKMVVDTDKHSLSAKMEIPAPPRTRDSVDTEIATQFHIFFTERMLSSTGVNATTSQGQDSDSRYEDSDSEVDSIVVERRRRARRAEPSSTKRRGRRGYLRAGHSDQHSQHL